MREYSKVNGWGATFLSMRKDPNHMQLITQKQVRSILSGESTAEDYSKDDTKEHQTNSLFDSSFNINDLFSSSDDKTSSVPSVPSVNDYINNTVTNNKKELADTDKENEKIKSQKDNTKDNKKDNKKDNTKDVKKENIVKKTISNIKTNVENISNTSLEQINTNSIFKKITNNIEESTSLLKNNNSISTDNKQIEIIEKMQRKLGTIEEHIKQTKNKDTNVIVNNSMITNDNKSGNNKINLDNTDYKSRIEDLYNLI